MFIIFPFLILAQDSSSFSRDLRLAKHLISIGDHEDAVFLLSNYSRASLHNEQDDSLNFYTGLAHHLDNELSASSWHFGRVGKSSGFYYKAKYFQAFDLLRDDKTDSSRAVLNSIDNRNTGQLEELKLLGLAGASLLLRDHRSFDNYSQQFTYSYPSLSIEQKNLLQYNSRLLQVKKRSPAVAGLMSAIIPGSGKLYAGKRAEAAAAFFQVAMLGAMTYENYKKLGPCSPQFIVFGGLFTVFYAGNIYGSAISVKVKREELLNEIDDQIMVDLRIPIDRIFK